MAMMIRRDEALEVLGGERLGLLQLCLDTAWSKYEAVFRPELPLCSPIGMANLLRELVIQQVRERFVGVPDVVIRDRNVVGGRFLAIVGQRAVLSFKKLTRDFQTANIPTDTSLAFDSQEPGIEGMPDLPRLTVGYQLGQFGTSLAGTYLAFVVGKECIWHHDLQTGAESIELEFPATEQSAAEAERADRGRRVARLRLLAVGTDLPMSDHNDADEESGENSGG